MKKLNKKGFTLIEMLVVIAIIAVLVAIIIPVVNNATTKAAAATNAANLRSIKAEATTELLNGVADTNGYVSFTPGSGSTAATITLNTANAPTAKACGSECAAGTVATLTYTASTNTITVKYGDYTINDFATVAENGGTLAVSGK